MMKAQSALDRFWEAIAADDELSRVCKLATASRPSTEGKSNFQGLLYYIFKCNLLGRNKEGDGLRLQIKKAWPEEQREAWEKVISDITCEVELPPDLFHFLIVGQALLWHEEIRRAEELTFIPPLYAAKTDKYGVLQSYRSVESTAEDDRLAGRYLVEMRKLAGQVPTPSPRGSLNGRKEKRDYAARRYAALEKENPNHKKDVLYHMLGQELGEKCRNGKAYDGRTARRWVKKGKETLEKRSDAIDK